MCLSPFKKRVAFPLKINGGWYRLTDHLKGGWEAHSCKVWKVKKQWCAHLIIRKNLPPTQEVEGIIGVDIGVKILASVTLNHSSFPLMEQYLRKDLAWKQHQFLKRRAKLQKFASHGSLQARRALKRLRTQERKYVYTRCGQIAREIVNSAVTTRSAIVLERVTHIRKRWTRQASKGKQGAQKSRKKINRWFFATFQYLLLRAAQLEGITVIHVNPRYTSQTCSRCARRINTSRPHKEPFCLW